MSTAKKQPYITEEEFNRIVIERNQANPVDDSKGDSAVDDTVEAELGEHFPEGSFDGLEDIEEEDRGHITTDLDRERIVSQTSDEAREGSSTWPDEADIPA